MYVYIYIYIYVYICKLSNGLRPLPPAPPDYLMWAYCILRGCTAVFILCYWLHGCDGWLADYWQLTFDMPKALIWDAWTLLFSIFWYPGAPFWWSWKARGSTEDILGSRSWFSMFLGWILKTSWYPFLRYFGLVSWLWGLNLRPEVLGCFLSDLGMNILPKYDGRMWRKPNKYRCFRNVLFFWLSWYFGVLEDGLGPHFHFSGLGDGWRRLEVS